MILSPTKFGEGKEENVDWIYVWSITLLKGEYVRPSIEGVQNRFSSKFLGRDPFHSQGKYY